MIDGSTRLTGLLGWPVKHSKSPRLHNEWLHRAAIDAVYLPLAVEQQHLARVFAALPRMGFVGVNVTVPHKQSILPLLDRLDPTAASIGAVNTVVFGEDGASLGLNTDASGFLENLSQADPEFRADAGPAVLLGAGGAARAAAAALLGAGVPELRLVNRSPASARALADALAGPVRVLAWQDRLRALEGAALLVNATSGKTAKLNCMLRTTWLKISNLAVPCSPYSTTTKMVGMIARLRVMSRRCQFGRRKRRKPSITI